MKQSIQLRLGQHLTMTPQLQQAIRLLQLSSLELQLEVQQALDSNLMLESADAETHDEDPTQESAEDRQEASESESGSSETDTALDDKIPDELPVDTQWDEIYDSGMTSFSGSAETDQRDFFETHDSGPQSLYDHLKWQMELTPFSETDQVIAAAVIDAINDDGYLSISLGDLHQGLLPEHEIEMDEMEAVLHRIQHFDPVGVGARDPQECLLIQLSQLDPATPWRAQAIDLVENQLDILASRDYNQLMRRLKLASEDLQNVINLVQSLNPRPGSLIASEAAPYVVPDVYVSRANGKWRVELNPESAPKLRINANYAGMVRRADNSDDNNYLRNHLQEARWFLKSLQSRNETLLKVASCIVEHQKEFLDEGDEAMKPLVLRDVAEAVEMHESTISRVTTQKYMHTPRGIFEFKYFFSSHVGTSDGGECSATAIRAMIRKLIADEPPAKPLSDSKIATILADDGIKVARRTIAKYREAMTIPPSNERKRLA